ncbi:hypothetical protein pb186bvf_006011 [Paramecium bursaria]
MIQNQEISYKPNDPSFVQLETPIAISDFANQIKRKDFEKEFGILRSFTETKSHEKLYVKSSPQIDSLNRYTNIIPYQHSLVSDDPQFYINANYIKDIHGNIKQFIATQGPKKESVDHFWHMIWVNKVQVIVMLCNLCEKGRSQCEQYWPNLGDQQVNGQYFVKVLDQKIQKDLVENTILVKNNQQEFNLKQFWWQGWPDFGVPAENSFPLIDYIISILIQTQKNQGKPVVHCSAGVGRTGTVLSMCYVKEALNSGKQAISIFSFVRKLREQRPLMVNTAEQYALIYKYALWLIQK